jgi:transposase
MKATSAAQHSSVISLLQEGYSVHQIQSRTGLGKSTVGGIKKEVDEDKENMIGKTLERFCCPLYTGAQWQTSCNTCLYYN